MAQPKQTLVGLRVIAVKTLAQVLHSNLSLDEALMSELNRSSGQTKPEFDRSWLYEMCSGVLRYKGRLDFIIDTYSLKKKPTGPLRRYLFTAVYQLLAQDTPSALVVSETVQAVREQEGEMPAKFVNALLRKVSDAREQWKSWEINEKTNVDEQLAWCSMPKWLYKKLLHQHGFEFTKNFSRASLDRPVTWYRNLVKKEAEMLPDGYQGNEAAGFVQDISNQKVIEAANEFLSEHFSTKLKKGEKIKVLDLCSAPGGKSLALASLGWSMVSTDKDDQRLQKVTENKNRLKFDDTQLQVSPYLSIYDSKEKWSAIWLDVPCMSTGIVRRHPEIKWNRTEKDLPLLTLKQRELIEWAVTHLEEQGVLIYSTCSLLKEENPAEITGLKTLKNVEFYPQNEPFGDGIVARFFVKQS